MTNDFYNWVAHYNDGNEIYQTPALLSKKRGEAILSQVRNKYTHGTVSVMDLDLSRLIRLTAVPLVAGLPTIVISFDINEYPRKRPVFFRQRVVPMVNGLPSADSSFFYYGIGWRKRIEGKDISSIMYLYRDGTIENSTSGFSTLEKEYVEYINNK